MRFYLAHGSQGDDSYHPIPYLLLAATPLPTHPPWTPSASPPRSVVQLQGQPTNRGSRTTPEEDAARGISTHEAARIRIPHLHLQPLRRTEGDTWDLLEDEVVREAAAAAAGAEAEVGEEAGPG